MQDLRHPLEVSAHSVHFARVNADAARLEERSFGVVHAAGTVSVAIVGYLVVFKCSTKSVFSSDSHT